MPKTKIKKYLLSRRGENFSQLNKDSTEAEKNFLFLFTYEVLWNWVYLRELISGFTYRGLWNWFYLSGALELLLPIGSPGIGLSIGGPGTAFTYWGPWNWLYLSGANKWFYPLGVLELVLPIGGPGTGFTYRGPWNWLT